MVEIEILMTHEMCKEDMQDSVLGPLKNLCGDLQKKTNENDISYDNRELFKLII